MGAVQGGDAPDGTTLPLTLRKEHYPFWSDGRLKQVKALDVLARSSNAALAANTSDDAHTDAFEDTLLRGLRVCHFKQIPLPAPVGTFESSSTTTRWTSSGSRSRGRAGP